MKTKFNSSIRAGRLELRISHKISKKLISILSILLTIGELPIEHKGMWKKREKTKSPKVLMVLIVATSIILASAVAVYVWAISRTPTIKLNCIEKSNDGTYVDITWKIESVSRPNVKWHNIKFKVWGWGFPYTETDTAPDDGEFQFLYKPKCIDVRNGQMFKIRLNAFRLGGPDGGGIIEMHLIYIPTNDRAGMDRVSAPALTV